VKIAEAASVLGVSKQAIHKRISQPQYKPHVTKKGNAIHISNEAFAMLKEVFGNHNDNNDNANDNNDNANDNTSSTVVVEMYERLLKYKDDELGRLTVEVVDLRRMLENQQILTLNAQAEVKRLSQPQEQGEVEMAPEEQKGFWQRIFGGGRP
jgi:hypothetical protein